MSDPNNLRGAPPREVHIAKKPVNWLAWILLALGILAALIAIARALRHDQPAAVPAAAPTAATATPPVALRHVTLPGGGAIDLAPATLNYDLQAFLASTAAAPRTFTFERLNFDTNKAEIRADDRSTLQALSQILTAYPKAAVRLIGYADTRGSDAANLKLGADRAASVAKALADAGIAPGRIATASGGDSNPIASNATAGGQAENRRTELVVTSK